MNQHITLLLCFLCFSCKSQEYNNNNNNLNYEDYEVLNVFFNKSESYSYLDNNVISKKEFFENFKRKFNDQLLFFRNVDSICNNSKDTLKLKFYCPLADSFKKFNKLLSNEDFKYIKEKYSNNEKSLILDFSKINNQTILKHTEDYYSRINYSRVKIDSNLKEFPSIRLHDIYYTENKEIAIIVFSIKETYTKGYLNYYILKKQKNIWWKSIGNIKI